MTVASEISVRPATADDRVALGRLGAMLVATHHAFDTERFISPRPDSEKGYGAFLAGELKRPEVVMLVAEAAGTVIGYAYGALEGMDWMALRGPAGVVYDLIVDPERRGGGVGRLLLDAVGAALLAKGAPRVVLFTAERNPGAQRLFERAGFRRTMIEMTWDPPSN